MSRIVIGDPHGCYKTLMALVAQLPPGIPITIPGDLIDRGNDSRLIVKAARENDWDVTMGNHEKMMVDWFNDLEKPEYKGQWSAFESNGGLRTLQSYEGFEEEMREHVEWMSKLPLYIEYPEIKNAEGRYLVVSHSNVGKVWKYRNNEEKKKAVKFEEQILWGRHNFEDNPEIYNIVGHTPQEYEPKIKSFYANVDTGAVFLRDHTEMYGRLTALQFPEMIVYTQKNIEHEKEEKNEKEAKQAEVQENKDESKES